MLTIASESQRVNLLTCYPDRMEGMSLADRLRETRKAMGLSQDTLAKRCAVSRTTITMIETGDTENPQLALVFKIAEVLGVDAKWLALGRNSTNASITKIGRDVWDLYVSLPAHHQEAVRQLITSLSKSPGSGAETGKYRKPL